MDREEFIRIYNSIINPDPRAPQTQWYILIEEYCKDKGKTDQKIIDGIKNIIFTPMVETDYCIETMLTHFRNKFEITRVIDKDNRVLKIF